jgi:hypothetical protein
MQANCKTDETSPNDARIRTEQAVLLTLHSREFAYFSPYWDLRHWLAAKRLQQRNLLKETIPNTFKLK